MLRFLILLLCLYGVTGEDPVEDPSWEYVSYPWKRLDYLAKTMTKLIHYKSRYDFWGFNPDPMDLESFGVDDYQGFFDLEWGSFHVRPALHGYSVANCTPVVNYETKEALLYVYIPEVNITGEYDVNWGRRDYGGSFREEITGNGSFHHSFKNVNFLLNFTVRMNDFYKFPLAENVHTQLSMESCKIWWENYAVNGDLWGEMDWTNYSRRYCEEFSSGWESSNFLNSLFAAKFFNKFFHSHYKIGGSLSEDEALKEFNWLMYGAEDERSDGLKEFRKVLSPMKTVFPIA